MNLYNGQFDGNIVEREGNIVERDEAISRLRTPTPEDGWSPAAWQLMQRDLAAFCGQWGTKAKQLGWSASELYGLASVASRRRFDAMGLVPMLAGKRVVEMTADRATIEVVRSGVRQTFIRHGARRAAEAATVKATSATIGDDMKRTFRTPIESVESKPSARPSRRYHKPGLPMKA